MDLSASFLHVLHNENKLFCRVIPHNASHNVIVLVRDDAQEKHKTNFNHIVPV